MNVGQNIFTFSSFMFIIVLQLSKDALLNNSGMFPGTILEFTLQCLFAIKSRKITQYKDFTFLLSPNLKLVFDGNVLISLSVCSLRLDLKFLNQI